MAAALQNFPPLGVGPIFMETIVLVRIGVSCTRLLAFRALITAIRYTQYTATHIRYTQNEGGVLNSLVGTVSVLPFCIRLQCKTRKIKISFKLFLRT